MQATENLQATGYRPELMGYNRNFVDYMTQFLCLSLSEFRGLEFLCMLGLVINSLAQKLKVHVIKRSDYVIKSSCNKYIFHGKICKFTKYRS